MNVSNNLERILFDLEFYKDQIAHLESLKKRNIEVMNLYPHRSENCQHNVDEIDLILLRNKLIESDLVDRATELTEPLFTDDQYREMALI